LLFNSIGILNKLSLHIIALKLCRFEKTVQAFEVPFAFAVNIALREIHLRAISLEIVIAISPFSAPAAVNAVVWSHAIENLCKRLQRMRRFEQSLTQSFSSLGSFGAGQCRDARFITEEQLLAEWREP
jgi:hypothetical protein